MTGKSLKSGKHNRIHTIKRDKYIGRIKLYNIVLSIIVHIPGFIEVLVFVSFPSSLLLFISFLSYSESNFSLISEIDVEISVKRKTLGLIGI